MSAETGPRIRVEVNETRLDGVTFADALVNGRPSEDCSQIPVGAPNLFYESVTILQLAKDRKHAIAFGKDEGKIVLIRDGEPIHSIYGIAFYAISVNEYFTKMIIASYSRADNGKIKDHGLIY